MIDNVDRMSVNILPFSLDRALSVEGSRICGPGPCQHLPDQPGSVFVFRVRYVRTRPGFSISVSI